MNDRTIHNNYYKFTIFLIFLWMINKFNINHLFFFELNSLIYLSFFPFHKNLKDLFIDFSLEVLQSVKEIEIIWNCDNSHWIELNCDESKEF